MRNSVHIMALCMLTARDMSTDPFKHSMSHVVVLTKDEVSIFQGRAKSREGCSVDVENFPGPNCSQSEMTGFTDEAAEKSPRNLPTTRLWLELTIQQVKSEIVEANVGCYKDLCQPCDQRCGTIEEG